MTLSCLPPWPLCRQVSATRALGSRLGDEITVGGIKYSDSLQADELLFKQASPSTPRRRPHQPGTLGVGTWEMSWGSQGGHVPVPQDLLQEGPVWALGGGREHTDKSAALTEPTFYEGAEQRHTEEKAQHRESGGALEEQQGQATH